MILKPKDREEWLAMRHIGIGGSDAGSILGVNKYRSNVDLWREKTGEYIPEDISDKHGTVVRIGGDAYEIVADLSAETGKSVSYIASRMIEFAAEHTRVEDEEK